MFRKTIFAVAAVATIVATIAATSLASATTADAKGFRHWGHGRWAIGAVVLAAESCVRYGFYRGVYTRYWLCD